MKDIDPNVIVEQAAGIQSEKMYIDVFIWELKV